MIQPGQRHPVPVLPLKPSGLKRIRDRRNFVFPAIFSRRKKVSAAAIADWAAERECGLVEFVARYLVAARRVASSKAPQVGRGRGRPEVAEHAAVVLIASALRDDVDGAARA